jgi:arginyl-tRNA synthetase
VITRELRHALRRALAAHGFPAVTDPGLRPTGAPGQYAASVALALGADPRETATALAGTLAYEDWIRTAEVTGPGYLTITITPEALAAVADSVTRAGPACVTSDALAGVTVPAAPPGDPLTAPTWEKARTALAARLTARLAAAAGATIAEPASSERNRLTLPAHPSSLEPPGPLTEVTSATSGPLSRAAAPDRAATGTASPPRPASRHSSSSDDGAGATGIRSEGAKAEPGARPWPPGTDVAAAVAFAGRDAVLFTLARAVPGKPLRVDQEIMARHVPGNPAYAVRYAHARAASGVRWAAASSAADTIGSKEAPQPALANSGPEPTGRPPELVDSGGYGGASPREILLDALSWLPERVATAARRGRPDEFARYLEDLASVTVDVLSSASHPGSAAAPGSDRLTLAVAARTGLAAGLGLLEVSAPDRL